MRGKIENNIICRNPFQQVTNSNLKYSYASIINAMQGRNPFQQVTNSNNMYV